MILAVLEKKVGIPLINQDVYANVVGGMKPDSTSIDLAVALAVYSSMRGIACSKRTIAIGEVGLTGDLRSIQNADKIVIEAERMGYEQVIMIVVVVPEDSFAACETALGGPRTTVIKGGSQRQDSVSNGIRFVCESGEPADAVVLTHAGSGPDRSIFMWVGGVRVIITNEDKTEILMVRQHHEGRDIWMVPGGGIEDGENSIEAAIREAKEETDLDIDVVGVA